MSELSGVFMLLTFVVFVGYGLFAASIRNHVISRPRVLTWMRRTFAGAFARSAPSSPSPIDDERDDAQHGTYRITLVHHPVRITAVNAAELSPRPRSLYSRQRWKSLRI